jgi:hypothetical protein
VQNTVITVFSVATRCSVASWTHVARMDERERERDRE